MAHVVLYSYGGLTIEVMPFSTETVGFEATADFAPKDILGSPRTREFVGLGDERIQFMGKLFPEAIASLPGGGGGGLNEIERLDRLRREATAHLLMRGDGKNFGWYFLEGVQRQESRLRRDGVARAVEYSFSLVRSPAPRAADYVKSLLRLFA